MTKVFSDELALALEQDLILRFSKLHRKVSFAIILIGNHKPSEVYVKLKEQFSKKLGVKTQVHSYSDQTSQQNLKQAIQSLSQNYDGLIIQLPLPANYQKENFVNEIAVEADIDGLSNHNDLLFYNDKDYGFIPATARAIQLYLDYYHFPYQSKRVCVVGQSSLVGKPITHLLKRQGVEATIYDANRPFPKSAKDHQCELIISTTGSIGIINENNLHPESIVVDVGFNKINRQVKGDVAANAYPKIALFCPPVRGIGPLTVRSLFLNLLEKVEKEQRALKKRMQ